jgi:hypothetical protein
MNSTLSKIQALWVALGSFLIVTGATSKFPWLSDIFSQHFVDQVLIAAGSVVSFYQFVRAIFVHTATIKTLAVGEFPVSYLINPFKVAA